MTALRNFNGLASWRNAENSLKSVNLTMPWGVPPRGQASKKRSVLEHTYEPMRLV